MFREEFSVEISSRRDIYASVKARYPAGLNLNNVKYLIRTSKFHVFEDCFRASS